jgi:hypothetical protein
VESGPAIELYSLRAASLSAVTAEITAFIQANSRTSDPIETPRGFVYDDFEPIVVDTATKCGAEIVGVDRPTRVFQLRMLADEDGVVRAANQVHAALRIHEAVLIRERDAPPFDWEQQTDDIQLFDVVVGSDEHARALGRFTTGGFVPKDVHFQRIQHRGLWEGYTQNRLKVAKENGGNPNEVLDLKHGTSTTDPRMIIKSEWGIDLRYCLAGLYGRAAYLAEKAHYSDHPRFVHRTADGKSQMFLCRALAGRVEKRDHNTASTVCRDIPHPTPGCHSIHGPVASDPTGGQYHAYMLYEKHRCYPEYLVTYVK